MPTSSLSVRTIRRRAAAVLATCFGAAAFAACGNPLGLRASIEVQFDTLAVYAMSGTPVTYPAAFDVGGQRVTRITAEIAFDVAFDIALDGRARLVPARQVAATRDLGGFGPSSSPRVGLQKATGTFESLSRAPNGGYAHDSTLVVATGEAVFVEVTSDICQFSLSSQIYGKLVVDSIDTAARRLYFRSVVDPNCGFRSLQPGIPRN